MTKRTFDLPIRTISEANCSEHWTKSSRRHKEQQFVIRLLFNKIGRVKLPCVINLVRLAPRLLDDDNLRSAFKWIRDEIAECLFPDKKKTYVHKGKVCQVRGMNDSNELVTWQYGQEKNRLTGIRIEIEELNSGEK